MAELFNGGEMDAFTPSDGSPTEVTSWGGTPYDTAFSRCGIRINTTGGSDITYIETAHWAAQTDAWLHFLAHHPQSIAGLSTLFLAIHDGSDNAIVRIRFTGGNWSLEYLDALSAWQVAGTVALPAARQTIDLHWDFQASGVLGLYVGGTERISFTGDLSHLTGVEYARFHGNYHGPVISQVMADTEPTIGHRLYTCPPAGTGANTAWVGTYTEIDEVAYSDADFINTGAADQVETVTISSADLTGYVVQSVTVSARAKTDGSGPANLQLALRSSGTDYFSSSKALDLGYGPFQNIWATNPATSAAWVNTAVSTLQAGVKSIT